MTASLAPLSARDAVEACLDRIADPAGEGTRTMLAVHAARARAEADAIDAARAAGTETRPLAGLPVSIKDLFDMAGEPTRCASLARDDAPVAASDAPAVARLREAGMIVVGRTNMTQFAFSGLGLNPHHGTPRNPWDRATGRIPGGSSSGAAVSVTDGMAWAGLGSDTGGSCRIPAALCGIVGFKPTQARVPRDGVLPLSTSLDSVGPLAASVAVCAAVDAVLAGQPPDPLPPVALRGLRLPVLGGPWLSDLDPAVAAAFARAVRRLADAGAEVAEIRVAAIDAIPEAHAYGSLAASEAFAWHRDLIARRGDAYDPMVRDRIERGGLASPAVIARLHADRARLIAAAEQELAGIDALLLPTCPIVAPPIADLDAPAEWVRVNALVLRNPAVVNFLDGCSISLPCHVPGEAPVGLMLAGRRGQDRRLLAIAAAIEALLAA